MIYLRLLVCGLLTCSAWRAGVASETDALTIGSRGKQPMVLLAIDDQSLPLKDNLCYYLSKPEVRQEPVLKPERDNSKAADELAAHFYGTVLHDQGKYRMWYYGVRRAGNGAKIACQICYAESDDGIYWQKPTLEQVEINGSKANNAVALVNVDTQGVCVIKDDDDPDPHRRYKMVVQYMPRDYPTLKTATSPDGFHWTDCGDLPARQFREISSFFKHDGMYVVCGHTPSTGDQGQSRGRQGFAWISPDFKQWPQEEAKSFWLPEPPGAKGYNSKWEQPFDQVHLGVGAASYGNVAVGLYGLWRQRGWGEEGTTCDFGLVLSNDGLHFREPIPGHVFMKSEDEKLPAVPDRHLPTILCQANGILNVGDETRIYYGRWRNSEWPLEGDGRNYYADVALATLPRDRWGALGLAPKSEEGSLWTAPIRLPAGGCVVSLNADSADRMRVDVADERFQLLPEFSGENGGVSAQTSGLNCVVSWPGERLHQLAGRTVRLRLQFNKKEADPRLFAIYLTSQSTADENGK